MTITTATTRNNNRLAFDPGSSRHVISLWWTIIMNIVYCISFYMSCPVLFVPKTQDSGLAKKLQEAEHRLSAITKERVRVTERAARECSSSFTPTIPLLGHRAAGPPASPAPTVHMGAEPPDSFKEGSRSPLWCIMTTRHHVFRNYVSPNQTCAVFGLFGLQS